MNSEKLHEELGKLESNITVRTNQIKKTLAQARELIVEHRDLRYMLKAAAKPDCRDCDGTGIFYSNVRICACVSSENALRKDDADEL